MAKTFYSVIIPQSIYPLPSPRELSAARLLANHFQCDITCVTRSEHKSPDFRIGKLFWELKTPTGTGKYNIQHALHSATRQSGNIIIDARFSKLHINKIKSILQHEMVLTKNIKRLLLIQKDEKVLEIYKRK